MIIHSAASKPQQDERQSRRLHHHAKEGYL